MMNRKLLTAGLVLALTLAMSGIALAATSDTGSATAAISAGSLAVADSGNDIAFSTTLDGTDQTLTVENNDGWTAADATGSGAGWHVNISATDFDNAGETHSIAVANFKVKLLADDITVTYGNTKPTSSMTTYTPLSTSAAALMSAATNAGMGSYAFDPDFSLDVAAETYADSYTSTVSIEIVSTP